MGDWRFASGCVLALLAAFNVTQNPGHAALGAALIWAAIAVSEALVPALQRSPAPAGPQPALSWLLRAYVPIQLALLAAGLVAAQRGGWGVVFGLAFAVGFVTGAQGITYAHELGHGARRGDRALAWVLMTCVNYPQFMVEHYVGHHQRAATWDDPASARPGESLWRFLPRTVAGNFLGAWQARLRRGPLATCTALNLLFLALLAGMGWHKALVFWLAQSAFAIWLLEAVNYIEHYGLQRRPGEPFGVQHAWNADHLLSNSLLANLQRHSDHHMHAGKRYPELEPLDGPQLPTGYAGCILLAAVPPLWFRLMDRRLGLAGVQPQPFPASRPTRLG
ncbi:MAG: alkane 1-monooxygenase [Burkholderiales bacterium]|nr:alkane 1-monooxygenase [Burkholderiales bacterium]